MFGLKKKHSKTYTTVCQLLTKSCSTDKLHWTTGMSFSSAIKGTSWLAAKHVFKLITNETQIVSSSISVEFKIVTTT